MVVTIIGGGNIGTYLIGKVGQNSNNEVRLLTSQEGFWSDKIEVLNRDGNILYKGLLKKVSSNPKEIIPGSDVIIFTVPSHIFPDIIERINNYLTEDMILGIVPGCGGKEYFCIEYLKRKNLCIFGLQRVPAITRIHTNKHSVYCFGEKSKLFAGIVPGSKVKIDLPMFLSNLLNIECNILPNYLNVTLTPSNPILHTSRIFSMFRDYEKDTVAWKKNPQFYWDWDDVASEILFECSKELQKLCNKLKPIDLNGVVFLPKYYESNTPHQLTEKLKSIEAFKGILSPLIKTNDGYIPDLSSRYFMEDFSYGLCIIKGMCAVCNVNTPMIDKILYWYSNIFNLEYFVNNKFIGKDLGKLPLPFNYGIDSYEKIIEFYK